MIEKKLYQEIPGGRNKFHSAVLTSFSFNFHHFEYQVLRTLRQKWISSVMVLVDQKMLDRELGMASSNLKNLSQSYAVAGIEAKGAFHPKINFLIGDDRLLLFFGSGNITPGGHGKNHEIFTGFYADKSDLVQLPIIIEAWNYLLSTAKDFEGYNKDRLIKVLPSTSDLLKHDSHEKHKFHTLDDEIDIALLYTDESPIFEQLTTLVPGDEVSKVTIVSPYYDENGNTLTNLKNFFTKARFDVFLSTKDGLPPVKMNSNKDIEFYDWEETKRGKQPINSPEKYDRKLHSKIFHFQTESHEYCMMGSANATVAAFGSKTENPINEEFCALYKLKNSRLLHEFGVYGPKKMVNVSTLSRQKDILTESLRNTPAKKTRISSADLSGRRLKIIFKTIESTHKLSICDSAGQRLMSDEFEVSDPFHLLSLNDEILRMNPAFVIFEDEQGKALSNKQLINYLDKLINTDPSKGNRTIRQVLNSLEGGVINEFEIIEFINDLNRGRQESNIIHRGKKVSSSDEEESIEHRAVEMTYQEAVEASRDKKHSEAIFRGHSSTRLWDTISRLFQEKKINIGEELMDEEEEGSAEKGRDRNDADNDQEKIIVKNKDQFSRMINSVTKLADNYVAQLNRISCLPDHEINELDHGNFLLVTHILTVVCNFKEYEFIISKKKNLEESNEFSEKDPTKYLEKIQDLYLDKMLNVLDNFARLLIQHRFVHYQEGEYQKIKFDDYFKKVGYHFWLYLFLIQRKTRSQVVIEKTVLVALNFLHFVGEPEKGFDMFLKALSGTYNDMLFNPLAVEKLYDTMISLYLHPEDHFIGIDHSGICRVLSSNSREIEFISLFSHNRISHAKFKKHRIY